MAKRKEPEVKKGLDEWMGTYGDMVTLLLCFFILLFAMSTLDVQKFQALVSGVSSNSNSLIQGGGGNGIDDLLGSGIMELPEIDVSVHQTKKDKAEEKAKEEMKQMVSEFKSYVAQKNLQEKIEIKEAEDYTIISFKDGILFDSGKAELRAEAIPILEMVANQLFKYPDNDIEIYGHTDNVPIKTVQFPSNWYLSASRAISVGNYFIDVKNFLPERVSATGRGEYEPIAPNDTPEGRAQNRRVEIRIKSKYASNTAK